MNRSGLRHFFLNGYAVAVISTTAAFMAQWYLQGRSVFGAPFAPYVIAIALSGWIGGVAAALLGSGLGLAAVGSTYLMSAETVAPLHWSAPLLFAAVASALVLLTAGKFSSVAGPSPVRNTSLALLGPQTSLDRMQAWLAALVTNS